MKLCEIGTKPPIVKIFNAVERSCSTLGIGQISWPCEWLLSHNRKHIFVNRHPPLQRMHFALVNWENKVRWRFHLADSPENPWRQLKDKTKVTPPCSYPLPASWEVTLGEVRELVAEHCRLKFLQQSYHRSSFSTALARFASLPLKFGMYGTIETDKDGGWSVIKKTDLMAEEDRVLNKPWYKKLAYPHEYEKDICILYDCVVQEFFQADLVLRRALLSSMHNYKHAFSTLSLKIKSHKDPGEIECRPIHMSVSSPFAPGMRFIQQHLRSYISQFPHVLRDSKDLCQKLSRRRFSPGVYMVRCDVKDFFLSGSAKDILRDVELGFADWQYKDAALALLKMLLDNQYVKLRGGRDSLWRCIRGTGMGLLLSGEVSDATLLNKLELNFLLAPKVRAFFGIEAYFRFKDDMILFLDSKLRFHGLMAAIQKRAEYYRITHEVHIEESTMLDLHISKGADFGLTGSFTIRPFRKSTSQWVALNPSSVHAPHVHTAWPLSLEKRYRGLCNRPRDADVIVRNFKRLYSSQLGRSFPTAAAHSRQQLVPRSRLILPYMPTWSMGLSHLLRKLLQELGNPDLVGVCWRNPCRNLADALKALNAEYHCKHENWCILR